MRPRPDPDSRGQPPARPTAGGHGVEATADPGRETGESRRLVLLAIVVVLVLVGVGVALATLQSQYRQALQDRFEMRAQLAGSYVALEHEQQARWLEAQAEARLTNEALDADAFAVAVRASPVRAAAITDADGRVHAQASTTARPCAALVDRDAPHIMAAAGGVTGISDVTSCQTSPERLVTIAVPVADEQGGRELVYAGALALTSLGLEAYLDEAAEVYGGEGYVVDSAGALLAATGGSSTAPRDADRLTLADLAPDLADALAASPSGHGQLDGVAARYHAAPVSGTEWQLVLVASDERLFAPVGGWASAGPWTAFGLLVLVSATSLWLLRDALRSREAATAARAALESANADLARSNRDLEQFAYAASHDLQEPLRKVASYTELLGTRYRGRLDADADVFIDYAVDGARRMQQLIQGLLTYSRVSRCTEREAVDLEAATRSALGALAPTLQEREATVTWGALPAVRGDRTALTLLLQNLVSNAVKFVEGRAPSVTIAGEAADGTVHLTVRDNGIGIAPEHLERIFGLFERLGARDAYPGTGLGLAICQRIVEEHGGRIWATSTVGEGTTMHLELPATAPPAPPRARGAARTEPQPRSTEGPS